MLTADDNGLTLIHAEVEKRDRNNSDANKFEITIFASFLTAQKRILANDSCCGQIKILDSCSNSQIHLWRKSKI